MIQINLNGGFLRDGNVCSCGEISPEAGRENTIAYQILRSHSISPDPAQMQIHFDALISQDLTYVGIIQTARSSGMKRFPIPYAMTNCHNSLCAVGGTINEDDHVFGLTAAHKYGGIYVPENLAVMHTYVREEMVRCGNMILGSDSHSRYGALGTMGFGEGGPELVKQLLERTYDIPAPEVVLCYLTGKPPRGVGPLDIALSIIGATFKNGVVKNKIIEFAGPGMKNLSADFRCNIDTMMVESSCLSSIWETDEVTENYYGIHGRSAYFKPLKASGTAYYDTIITVDLNKAQSMIAMPFHPSNVYTIHEFQEHAEEIFDSVQKEADELFGIGALSFKDKVKNHRPYADQGSVAGCAGGLYENLMEMAAILEGKSLGNNGFNVTAYPSSMPVNLALTRAGAVETLLSSGVIMKPCICGSCSGYGDTPANQAFSIRHATRNFPNREGSKPNEKQYSSVALMDARSIAATAANGGRITAGTDAAYTVPDMTYTFDRSVYEKRVFYGYGNADPSVEIVSGPNIVDWPEMEPLGENCLLKLSAVIRDKVTSTDELIPSGDTASYRSNPIRLADYTLCRRVPGFAGICREIQADEKMRMEGNAPEHLMNVLSHFGNAEALAGNTQYGSCLFAVKPGDGSAREQAASCQKVLGGLANICAEYATKRYRSNCINWGILPFVLPEGGDLPCGTGDYIFIPGIRDMIKENQREIPAKVLTGTGETFDMTLMMGDLTEAERDILLKGCLINYYKELSED